LPPAEIAAVRLKEGIAAAAKINATYHCVGEPDVNLVVDKPTIRKVTDLFRRVAPTLVFTHPRHDYMLDHEAVHTLARAAAFSYPIPNASSLPLVDGSAIPWLYYCDPIEGRDPYTGELVEPTTYVDVSEQLNRKIEMLVCHASQREWLRAHHGMDEYVEAMKRYGAERGRQIGVPYAEAFVLHRGHAFPHNDILAHFFSNH
jgi:N-acetylglucosamine malate deacetylase 1